MSLALPDNPKLGGTVEVTFTVDGKGRTRKPSLSADTLKHQAARSCILSAVKRWRFPKPEGKPAQVVFPFHLKPMS